MKATDNIDIAEVISNPTTGFEDNGNAAAGAGNIQVTQAGAKGQGQRKGKPESELRAAARRRGLTLKELAVRMGVNYGYLSSVSAGRRPWTPMLRERAMQVLGEVPGPGVVYRQGGLVQGESTYIRERARELGMSLKELAGIAGVGVSYLSQASRGERNMSPGVQARVEAALDSPARIEPAERANRPGGPGEGGELLHPGAGHEPEGVGEAGGGELRVPVGRGPGPQVHEPEGPGAGGGIVGGSGQGSSLRVSPALIAGRCGTAWMHTISARTRPPGWPASAPGTCPRS